VRSIDKLKRLGLQSLDIREFSANRATRVRCGSTLVGSKKCDVFMFLRCDEVRHGAKYYAKV
jgi:hypothetical protein